MIKRYSDREVVELIGKEILSRLPEWIKIDLIDSRAEFMRGEMVFETTAFNDRQCTIMRIDLGRVKPPMTVDEAKHGAPHTMTETYKFWSAALTHSLPEYENKEYSRRWAEFQTSIADEVNYAVANITRWFQWKFAQEYDVIPVAELHYVKRAIWREISLPANSYKSIWMMAKSNDWRVNVTATAIIDLLAEQLVTIYFTPWGEALPVPTEFGMRVLDAKGLLKDETQ